jgi:hypothetical protein
MTAEAVQRLQNSLPTSADITITQLMDRAASYNLGLAVLSLTKSQTEEMLKQNRERFPLLQRKQVVHDLPTEALQWTLQAALELRKGLRHPISDNDHLLSKLDDLSLPWSDLQMQQVLCNSTAHWKTSTADDVFRNKEVSTLQNNALSIARLGLALLTAPLSPDYPNVSAHTHRR